MSEDVDPFRVVEVIDQYRCAINKGFDDGIQIGQRFLIYGLGKEILDPDSGESLGVLEIVRGRGKVTHTQSRLSTIETYEKEEKSEKIIRRNSGLNIFGQTIEEIGNKTDKPFDGVSIGDYAKII